MDLNKPLMWTARGNVEIDTLTYAHEWKYDGTNVALHETWHFADGELARNNIHMLHAPGLPIMHTPNDVTVGLTGHQMGAQQAVMQ